MDHHIHVGAIAVISIVAIMGATHFLVRGLTAKHNDAPWAQGLSWLF
jgi:hypothetical protein